jgi:hypothetical protein
VSWLRAKARYDRWNEELLLVRYEMTWALTWYAYQRREWERRAVWAEMQHLSGHRCYAEKQVVMWRRMGDTAATAWDHMLKLPGPPE